MYTLLQVFLAFHSCVSIPSPLEGAVPFHFQTPAIIEDRRAMMACHVHNRKKKTTFLFQCDTKSVVLYLFVLYLIIAVLCFCNTTYQSIF